MLQTLCHRLKTKSLVLQLKGIRVVSSTHTHLILRSSLPVLELSKSYFHDDVFKEDAGDNVSGDDGKKDPAEVLEPGRRQQQREHAFHWSVKISVSRYFQELF